MILAVAAVWIWACPGSSWWCMSTDDMWSCRKWICSAGFRPFLLQTMLDNRTTLLTAAAVSRDLTTVNPVNLPFASSLSPVSSPHLPYLCGVPSPDQHKAWALSLTHRYLFPEPWTHLHIETHLPVLTTYSGIFLLPQYVCGDAAQANLCPDTNIEVLKVINIGQKVHIHVWLGP